MFGYTLRKRPIHIFAETTQNIGWIRPEFVLCNNGSGWVDSASRLHTTRQTAALVRGRMLVFIVERDISVDGAPVNSRVLKSRY
jgi:hypothetical protein